MWHQRELACKNNVPALIMPVAACLLLVCSMATVTTALDTSLYSGMEVLDPGFRLYWNLNQADASIRFAIRAKTAGFVGLGISEVGAMVGTDMMMGTVENGMAAVIDAFAYNKSQVSGVPAGVVPDSQQDVKTISGEESVDANGDTWTTLEFSRPLKTTDCNDRPIAAGTNQIIWAMGATDSWMYHGNRRGGTQIAFYGSPVDTVVPADHEKYNLTVKDYKVPSDYTTYLCNTYNFTFAEKRHISSYSVIIDTNAPQSLHHIVIHSCEGEEVAPVSARPRNLVCGLDIGCSRVMVMWAVGGKPVVLPDFAGLLAGPGTGAQTVVMQMHYTNPEGRTDIVDNSGISFTLAPTLRRINAGILPLGPYIFTAQIRIPPGQKSWKMESTCSSGCMTQNIVGNITIIGSTLHQHVLGKQLWTTLSRNGTEIATINRADYYDFEFQTMIRPSAPVVVLPGDVLKTTCIWDSSKRTEVTLGGESTLQEMCLNYVLYYPLQQSLNSGCLDLCMNPNAKNESTAYQPPFDGDGAALEICNGDSYIQTNKTCLYGPTGGQNEVVAPLAGCPASSLAKVPAATMTQLQVPAKTTTASTATCTFPFGGRNILFQNCQTLSGGYTLRWNTTNGQTVTVGFSHSSSGWIAFGISPSGGMVGSSAIVGFPSTSQGVTVDSYFLGGKSSRAVQPPGKLTASSLQGEFVNGELRLLFTLSLTAEQVKTSKIVWARGEHKAANGATLTGHNGPDGYAGTISFATGATTTSKPSNLRNVHGIINAVAWGILIPIGAMLARYAKGYDPAWFYAHIAVQTSGFLLGLSGLITGFILHNRSKVERRAHLAIAIIILGLSFLQILGAIPRPKPDAKLRSAWNLYHHWTGRAVIVLAIANIFVGLSILKPGTGWVVAYSIILGLMVAMACLLEARKIWLSFHSKTEPPSYKANSQRLPSEKVTEPEDV